MKKTILSLTAVLTMLASGPAIYAAPVVDSASKVSVNKFVSTEPKVNINYQSKAPGNDVCIYEINHAPEIISIRLKPGESKVVEYVKLLKGETLSVGPIGYDMILADGSTIYKKLPSKEITAKSLVKNRLSRSD